MSVATLVGIAVVILVASFLQGLSGFGFSLLAVPLLAVLVGAKEAVVLADTVALLATGGMAVRMRRWVDRPLAARVLLGSVIGMPIGLLVILEFDESALRALIGIVVLVFVGLLAGGWTLHRSSRALDVGAGVVSGLLNTSVGTSGPPVVLLLTARGLPRDHFRATTSAVFGVSAVVAIVLFAVTGQYTRDIWIAFLWSLPALPAGWLLGDRVSSRLGQARFRSVILGLLACTGVTALVAAALG